MAVRGLPLVLNLNFYLACKTNLKVSLTVSFLRIVTRLTVDGADSQDHEADRCA